MRIAALLLLGLAAAGTIAFGGASAAEAWLIGFLALISLSVGAVGALAVGHLLREDWTAPVRAPLEAAARLLPLAAMMALPVLALVETLYPWAGAAPPPMPAPRAAWLAPWPFHLRAAGFLLLWLLLGWLLTRRGGARKRLSAVVLVALAVTVPLAAQDWALSRDPGWWGSLHGFSLWIEGIMAALAAAALVSLAQGAMPPGETDAGEALERALLALGLATLWLWFMQFIVVWMTDLPQEAGWYLRRMEGAWGVVKLGVAVPALLLALALAAPPRHRGWRMAAVCALLLGSHGAQLLWLVLPSAPTVLTPALPLLMLLACTAWWRGAAARQAIP